LSGLSLKTSFLDQMFARSQLAISVVAVQNFYWLREVALSWSSGKGYLGSGKHLLKNIMKKSHII